MATFDHSLARFAVWNLAGNTPSRPGDGIPGDSLKAENQAKGLALLDADFVTLVEVSPISHIEELANRLTAFGLTACRVLAASLCGSGTANCADRDLHVQPRQLLSSDLAQ